MARAPVHGHIGNRTSFVYQARPGLNPPKNLQDPLDRLDVLLTDYEQRKQDETQRQVQRAIRLEESRKVGADLLRRYAIEAARNVAERLQMAGHRVVHQEFLNAYPPNVRIHLWPKGGPLDEKEPQRTTFELVWGEPSPDVMSARRWTSEGLHRLQIQSSARSGVLDELWVREQLMTFVRETLSGA